MPLNRPALALGVGPRGVQDARRWVVAACQDMGRDDLAECAEIGVSELVTNALLHGAAPIQVRVRGTAEHPRVEVRDGSTEPPVPSGDPAEGDDLLTFGRGLSIVARAADAWGAEIEEDGKVVWFAPAATVSEGDGAECRITGLEHRRRQRQEPDAADLVVEIHDVPVRAYVAFQRHYRELRREVRLLALAHESHYPLAKTLSDLFGSLERPLREEMGRDQIDVALASGLEHADLRVPIVPATAERLGGFVELLDLADAFCREERLLSVARSPEQRAFQTWLLGEFLRQSRGETPRPWTPSESRAPSDPTTPPDGVRRTSVS